MTGILALRLDVFKDNPRRLHIYEELNSCAEIRYTVCAETCPPPRVFMDFLGDGSTDEPGRAKQDARAEGQGGGVGKEPPSKT